MKLIPCLTSSPLSTYYYGYVWAGIFSAYMWILKSAGWLDGCHTFIRYLLKYSYSQERRHFSILRSNLSIGILGESPNSHLSSQKFLIKECSVFLRTHCILKYAFMIMCWMPSLVNRVSSIYRVLCNLDLFKIFASSVVSL